MDTEPMELPAAVVHEQERILKAVPGLAAALWPSAGVVVRSSGRAAGSAAASAVP